MTIKLLTLILLLLSLACGPLRGDRLSDDPKIAKEAEGMSRCKTEEGMPYDLPTDSCIPASKEICDEWNMTFDESNMKCIP